MFALWKKTLSPEQYNKVGMIKCLPPACTHSFNVPDHLQCLLGFSDGFQFWWEIVNKYDYNYHKRLFRVSNVIHTAGFQRT